MENFSILDFIVYCRRKIFPVLVNFSNPQSKREKENYMYNNNYYAPQPAYQQRPPISTQLKGRPVSSIEEAKASLVDFDGSVFYFPDLANKRIYTKQINLDGTASLLMYELKEIPTETPTTTGFITREEFAATISQIKETLSAAVIKNANLAEKKGVPEFKF
jgi:hypothetical protein